MRFPLFSRVGTIKGLTPDQMGDESMDCQVESSKCNHLSSKPGAQTVAGRLWKRTVMWLDFGGLHKFMQWDRNILTDSGGFQMVSLLSLAEITGL